MSGLERPLLGSEAWEGGRFLKTTLVEVAGRRRDEGGEGVKPKEKGGSRTSTDFYSKIPDHVPPN